MKVGFIMKKNVWKWIMLASVSALVVGCANNESSEGEANSGSESSTETAALPEPGDYNTTESLQLSGVVTRGNIEDDNWVQQKLEDQFNVEIENTKIDTWSSDETAVMIASGDLPDVWSFTGDSMKPQEYYENGLTRTIPREMIEKYAPMYAQMLDEIDNGLGWEMHQSPDNPDEYLSLVGLQSHAEGLLWAPTLRLDWMEELGIDIPEDATPIGDSDGFERIYFTDHSYSLEELEEILTAFTFEDPDGNGQDDTYGMMPFNDNLNWGITYFGSYGIAPHNTDWNLMENDELITPVISENYKDSLVNLADWYDKGIIDPEWTTLTERTAWEKYQQGKIGYYLAQRTYLAQEDWTTGRAPHNLIQNDPDAKLLVFPGEDGEAGVGQGSFMPVTLLGDQMQIAADVTDEELARYLQIFDFINHDEEGVWATYGNPGEHSDWAGEEGKSTLVVRDEYPREEGDMGFWAYNHRSYPGDRFYWLTHMKTIELMENHFNVPEVVEELEIRPHTYDLFNETDKIDIESRYKAQLDTLVNEFRMNGITGAIDIESDWDQYVENYLNNGGKELIDAMNQAPTLDELLGENPKRTNVEPLE